jgi:hypothetical protein
VRWHSMTQVCHLPWSPSSRRTPSERYGSRMEALSRQRRSSATRTQCGIVRVISRSRLPTLTRRHLPTPRNEGVPGSSPGVGSGDCLALRSIRASLIHGRSRQLGRGWRSVGADRNAAVACVGGADPGGVTAGSAQLRVPSRRAAGLPALCDYSWPGGSHRRTRCC